MRTLLFSHILPVTKSRCCSSSTNRLPVLSMSRPPSRAESHPGRVKSSTYLGVGFLGVHQTSRVHLDLLHVDPLRANQHSHLVAVARAVVSVGRWLVADQSMKARSPRKWGASHIPGHNTLDGTS
jgi:hypothetical protein